MDGIAPSPGPDRVRDQSALLSDPEFSIGPRQDLLRRFTPTPYTADLRLMQRTVRLETNSESMKALALKFFERHQHGSLSQPEFRWRIVCHPDPQVQSTDVHLIAFSDSGVRYVNVGQRSFLAVDLENREAVGFLADRFVDHSPELRNNRLLDLLFCMTASSLGLTALSGGCVGLNDRGVLVFGPPNSGKTTACYLAAKRGLEFHADQMVFLDVRSDAVRVWGDFFPAVFRPETLEFLPELKTTTRASSHAGLAFHYLDKAPLQARWARPVLPVCSVFLDRETAMEPRLEQISKEESETRMRQCLLFKHDLPFESEIDSALHALADRPTYCLRYGSDPQTAADFIETLLQ